MMEYKRLTALILISIQITGGLLQDFGGDDLGSLEDGGGGDELVEKPLGKCPPAPSPPHAVVVVTPKDTSISSVVKMKCGQGYEKVGGSTNRVCQPTLKWTGNDIVCKALECPRLVTKNTVANTTVRTFGTVVKFSCRNGTSRPTAEGDTIRICQADQLWSGSAITCLPPQCPRLKIPKSTIASTRTRSVGVVVKLSCADGTVNVTGDQQITCGKHQKWKGKILICKVPQCKRLKAVPHSKRNKEDRSAGAIVKFTCAKDYKSEGSAYTMCNKKTLQWTKLNFKCTRKGRKKAGKKRSRKSKSKGKKHGKHGKRKGRKRAGKRSRKSKSKGKKHGKPALGCSRFNAWRAYYIHGVRARGNKHQLAMSCLRGWVRQSGEKKIFCRKQGKLMVWSGKPLVCKLGSDLADGKPLYQSSSPGPTTDYSGCSVTTGKDAPWWFVDLKAEYPIASVTVHKFDRGKLNKQLARSLKDFTISVTNTKPANGTYKANKEETCVYVNRASKRWKITYKCKSVKVGRYVVISMQKKFKLGLCKLWVWPKASVASLKQASQSSTFGNYSARLAVDGDFSSDPKSNSCSMTSHQNNPWWVVDLKHRKTVSRVILFHKSDRTATEQLANFTVSVTNKKPSGEQYQPAEKEVCYTQREAVVPGSVTSLQFQPAKKGRFIVVSRAGAGVLSLCEALIY